MDKNDDYGYDDYPVDGDGLDSTVEDLAKMCDLMGAMFNPGPDRSVLPEYGEGGSDDEDFDAAWDREIRREQLACHREKQRKIWAFETKTMLARAKGPASLIALIELERR